MIDLKILAPSAIKYFGDLHPFRKWNKEIRDAGINVEIYYDHTDNNLLNAEKLLVHHRYFDSGWVKALSTATDVNSEFIAYLTRLKGSVGKLIWFDADDSSGTTQFPVIPFVDVFVKKQVLKDRDYYVGPLNEKKNLMVWSDQSADQKKFSPCDSAHLHKLKVGWNIGYNDYRDFLVHYKVRKYLSHFVNYKVLPINYTDPRISRPFDITFRGTVNYATSQKVVSDQRNKVLEMFKSLPYKVASGSNVNRNKYLGELKSSKISVSPFGFGEICFRDFETFISGSLLVKPSMEHLDTLPSLYIANETYVPISWDTQDFRETLDRIMDNYNSFRQIAINGQELYKRTMNDHAGFIQILKEIIS